jgi:hypothetical protein
MEEQHSVKNSSSEAGRVAQRRKVFLRVMIDNYLSGTVLATYFGAMLRLPSVQLRAQLTQVVEHSMLPDRELLQYFARIQREVVASLRDTLPV